jgi:hypothetical protein
VAYALERAIEVGVSPPVEKPPRRPTNTFLLQALEPVEALDGLGIVAVAKGEVDEGTISAIYDAFTISEFYTFLNMAMYRLTRVDRYKSLVVPYAYRGLSWRY